MGFPSLPIYSSDPLIWPQQQVSEGGGSCQNNGHHLQPPPPPPDGDGGGGGSGSIKPVYMADRARLAKIPQPEAALKCPRCESTNTKFCYFNNYSLTQPRHFCKTCRRYWTRGGALRNVPVGGGYRRNKRAAGKGRSRSKSPAAGDSNFSSSSTSSVLPPTTNSDVIITHFPQQHLPNFLTHNQYGGLSFGGIQVGGNDLNNNDVEFQMNNINISNGFSEQWRLQQGHHQFPNFLNGMEEAPATGNMYTFTESPQNRSKAVKMEDNNQLQGLDLSRNFLGISGDHNQYWGGGSAPAANAWTELGGFTNSNSSTTHIL